ncbi:uncharacterized protein LOC118182396 [Stegodyphus dumicola]|uniref:uncharacterized protein LOC118182396 n=1 Tax=Stegodyphus dumicola TaxID=202533 RepID=UPI0015AF057E|nr:uncharacterized protein LOC118182396 [Stegodyphus dumicola]
MNCTFCLHSQINRRQELVNNAETKRGISRLEIFRGRNSRRANRKEIFIVTSSNGSPNNARILRFPQLNEEYFIYKFFCFLETRAMNRKQNQTKMKMARRSFINKKIMSSSSSHLRWNTF